MKRSLVILLTATALVAGCGGGGQAPIAGAPGSISGSVTVEGLNLEPGDPGGILVYLKERPDKNAVTTAVGSYNIAGVPEGVYTVVLESPTPPQSGLWAVRPAGPEQPGVRVFSGVTTINVNFALEAVPAPPEW